MWRFAQVGSLHVPYLHEQFSAIPNLTTISIMQVQPPLPGDTEDVKRLSCALSTPDILKIRSTAALEGGVLNAVAFINRHGL